MIKLQIYRPAVTKLKKGNGRNVTYFSCKMSDADMIMANSNKLNKSQFFFCSSSRVRGKGVLQSGDKLKVKTGCLCCAVGGVFWHSLVH